MIELREVTKRYGRRGAAPEAVRALSLTFSPGTVWAVVGPNGAGKSTLLSLLLGFIRPTEGAITIAGETPRDYLREHGAGYLPERFSLPARWRAGEALRMFSRLERVPAADAERTVELLGLAPHLDKRAGELSRGLLQRVGLAQALLARRSLIVLDEPTEGLDPVWRVRLRDIVAELRAESRTMVIASHDLSEIERIADRALVLDSGAVRDLLDVRGPDITAEYRLRLDAPCAAVAEAFPGADQLNDREYLVHVTGAAELSQRLGGLIALGAVIAAVEPVRRDLEERVRTALDGDG
ncbi:MAG TPA: ABC transporter ATP-binding protein [Longimicrobiales bacterium]|nr:ABC transporter ATP-binding protein [Longimicrobiales bacterium]